MDILQNNPYRILGVFSNSPAKERLANLNRAKAFLRVGKTISFPLDVTQYCLAIKRTEASVAEADARLTLPKDQMLYAQFWFIKVNPFDEVAFKHLESGAMDKAEEIWQKKECASSLQNRTVCALIRKDLKCAIFCAEKLYGNSLFLEQFVSAVLGNVGNIQTAKLGQSFIDGLCAEFEIKDLLAFVTFDEWREYIEKQAVKPLIANLQNAVDEAKKSKDKGVSVRLSAGETLKGYSIEPLGQLKSILSVTDLQYQMIADKVGLEILQCSIDYYNDSEEITAAYKAMELAKYAQDIVVGQMAKDRCNENIQTLENIISKLPPLSVMGQHLAIQGFLKSFAQKSDLICHSVQLIKECAPYIVAIKDILGKGHRYYLKISTTVVNEALGNVIAEVNAAQKKDFPALKKTLISAWQAQLYLDKFDLEEEYKNGRFKQNRHALYDIIEKCKGFENPDLSFMYTYGCGWCQRLDVSDLDLRTDDETYLACHNLTDYKTYLRRFPNGKHANEAKEKIEFLTFHAACTVDGLESFMLQYPRSKYIAQAKVKMTELKTKIARQNEAISKCRTTTEVVRFYRSEDSKDKDFLDRCSSKAFSLAKREVEYRQVISTFGKYSVGGKRAKEVLDKIEKERRRKAETETGIVKWIIGIIVAGILAAIFISMAHDMTESSATASDSTSDSAYVENYSPSSQNVVSEPEPLQKTQEEIDYDKYINNQLRTGAKPYKKYYKSHTGSNYLDFRTSGCDYVIIVKNYRNSRVVNHVYVRAGEVGRLYLPNGTYNIFFYGGKGWNPNKQMAHVRGGFVLENGGIQKDEYVELYNQYGEYTLYPVQNGNLHLETSSEDEAL